MRQLLQWDRIKDLILFVPALHLFLCLTYLFFYEASFGHGVHNFSSPTDVFSLSISRIAPTYVGLMITLPLMHVFFRRQEIKRIARKKKGQHRPGWRRLVFTLFLLAILLGFSVGILILAIIGRIYTGFWPIGFLAFPLGLILAILVVWIFKKFELIVQWLAILSGAIAMATFVSMTAMAHGQMDRAMSFRELSPHLAKCKDFAILMPLSDNFLAVRLDNSRAVITEKCELLFEIYTPEEYKPYPRGLLYAGGKSQLQDGL